MSKRAASAVCMTTLIPRRGELGTSIPAWSYRLTPRGPAARPARTTGQPWAGVVGRLACLRGVSTLTAFGLATAAGLVGERSEVAGRRLHRRWRSFDARGQRSTVAAVAIARERAGWCWS